MTHTSASITVMNDRTAQKAKKGGMNYAGATTCTYNMGLTRVKPTACRQQEDRAGFTHWAADSLRKARYHTDASQPPDDYSCITVDDNLEEAMWPANGGEVDECYYGKNRGRGGGGRWGYSATGVDEYYDDDDEEEEDNERGGDGGGDGDRGSTAHATGASPVTRVPPPNAFFPRHIHLLPSTRDRQQDPTPSILREHMACEQQKSRDGMIMGHGVWEVTFTDGKVQEHYKATPYSPKLAKYIDFAQGVVSSSILGSSVMVLTRTGENRLTVAVKSTVNRATAAGHLYRGSIDNTGLSTEDTGEDSTLPTFEIVYDQKVHKGDAPYSLGLYPPPAVETGAVFNGFGKAIENRAMALITVGSKKSKATTTSVSKNSQHVMCLTLFRVVPENMFGTGTVPNVDATKYSDLLVVVSVDLSLVVCPSERYKLAANHLSACKPLSGATFYKDPSESWHHAAHRMTSAGKPRHSKPWWVEDN